MHHRISRSLHSNMELVGMLLSRVAAVGARGGSCWSSCIELSIGETILLPFLSPNTPTSFRRSLIRCSIFHLSILWHQNLL
ncbi:Protein of unknown function [Pyronema omphalodes CBS 100304]|uniref:Secreted protein n=1 Tax=Pyronema omphalodes (strain CBS 100304) TaxID=1076935 RepID=U4L437_PYROM|nr:Protein of unknown function [Pyronema omphalodes CBS 100304]